MSKSSDTERVIIQNWKNVEGIFYFVGEYRVVATKSSLGHETNKVPKF